MSEIKLPGLVANKLGGFLATVGLYRLIPDAKIRWEKNKAGRFHSVLETKHNGISDTDSLIEFLIYRDNHSVWYDFSKQKSFEKICPKCKTVYPFAKFCLNKKCKGSDLPVKVNKINPEKIEDCFDATAGGFTLELFKSLYENNPDLAFAISTDTFFAKSGDNGSEGFSEFRKKLAKRICFGTEYQKFIYTATCTRDCNTAKPEMVKNLKTYYQNCLNDPFWEIPESFQDIDLPDNLSVLCMNSESVYSENSGERNSILPISLLSLYSWSVYPTFSHNFHAKSLGVNKEKDGWYFYYPIWERARDRNEFMTLVSYPKIFDCRNKEMGEFLNGLGIPAVFRNRIIKSKYFNYFCPSSLS